MHILFTLLFLYILAEVHSVRKERGFFGHLLVQSSSGLIMVFYFWKLFVSRIPGKT